MYCESYEMCEHLERRTHSIYAAITEQYSTEGNDKKMVNKAKCLTMGGEARK